MLYWLWSSLPWFLWIGVNALEVALMSSLNVQETLTLKLVWSLECLFSLNEDFLSSSHFFLPLLITFNHFTLMNWSTLHFIRFEVNMTIVDHWRRENSRWRPFAQVEKSRKIAIEAVSPTPSRLVTSESRLLKKKSFWSPSVKNLVSGLESTLPSPGVDSWVNSIFDTVL